ncbi:MAG: GerMN domain-containing protein [bacterium]|nr:GerMN domain-containing protein [bacterium]
MKIPTFNASKAVSLLGIAVVVLLGAAWWLGGDRQQDQEQVPVSIGEARATAYNWVVQESSTYTFDGSDLQFEEERVIEEGRRYEFTFSFESSAAGYGDRTDQMLAQVITPHVIVIVVDGSRVVSVVTDNTYLELEEKMVEEEQEKDQTEKTSGTTVNAGTETTVLVFFGKEGTEEVFAVKRSIPATLGIARAAIQQLLGGPLQEEKVLGYISYLPAGVSLKDLRIQEGVAYVDFDSSLETSVSGSARVLAVREQIISTLSQFSTVQDVRISIDGNFEGVLQP